MSILKDLKNTQNPDMKTEIYGELLNSKGIKIRLTNVEYIDETVIKEWKTALGRHGYTSVVEHEISSGFVTITCKSKENISLTTIGILLTGTVLVLRYYNILP